jgi:hypothetical protein
LVANIVQKILSRHYALAEFANMLADPINATIDPNCGATTVGIVTDLGELEARKTNFRST